MFSMCGVFLTCDLGFYSSESQSIPCGIDCTASYLSKARLKKPLLVPDVVERL